jgi:hypothetical protein
MRQIHYAMTIRSTGGRVKAGSSHKEAVMKKEALTSLVVGVIGLVAPFIVVLLLHTSSQLGH